MIRAAQNQIEPIARLLTDCFIDDPLTIMQLQGISDQKDFLEKLFRIQLEVFEKTRDVFISDDKCQSVLIGYEKKNFSGFKQLMFGIQSSAKLRRLIGKNDFTSYSNNVRAVAKIVDLNWHKQFVKNNYYHINIIAVAPEEQGQGNSRALIGPIVKHCNENNLPIILETVDPKLIVIYESLGFELAKTLSDKGTGTIQYCFIKYPNNKW